MSDNTGNECKKKGTNILGKKNKAVAKIRKANLTDWDWTTLVAAWRYYEHRHTIASAMFPSDMVKRFWGKRSRYSDADRERIAHQFAKIDHGLKGEGDWTRWLKTRGGTRDCDCAAWTTFYQFCRGWVDGYTDMTVSNGKRTETVKAFFTEYTKKWTPVDGYIESPYNPPYIPQEYIKSKKGETK